MRLQICLVTLPLAVLLLIGVAPLGAQTSGWRSASEGGSERYGSRDGDAPAAAAPTPLGAAPTRARVTKGSATLPNDETPGSVDDDDYGVWKAHFGESLPGSGSAALSPVPEPSIVAVLTAAMLVGGCLRKSLVRRIAVHGRG